MKHQSWCCKRKRNKVDAYPRECCCWSGIPYHHPDGTVWKKPKKGKKK